MLKIEALNAHYGASHILHGVDLALAAGTISAVLGRNGVGKTTTLRAVMGLVPPTSGSVRLSGIEIAGWATHRIARAGVAYVPEGRQIFPDLSVVENIRVAERRPARIWPVSRLFGLFPALRERGANKGSQLSGGEQQMLAIARALVSDPKVLLLDEPSQGLAPLVVRELAQVIRQLRNDGVTILLIEQNERLAEEVADDIHIMVKGRIVYDGTPSQYRSEEEMLRRRYLTV
jgi:branched-chain amino acid transport system ATP-binding protein